ncbi:hypothetical protein HPB49_012568 [Dermacentor silvarum]|uniref:Uncharacterized protein n=1 Tax=Dermacentor silvarum TaxID=543639 RepID=A0ACB8C3N1_DERSI|nr:hypothetical protein HPB49_012568 [Dermacentor silvarum]
MEPGSAGHRVLGRAGRAPDGDEILSSLPYQVLLVFGGWFYVLFAAVELFLLLFKGLSFPYPSGNMASEVCLLAFLTVIESVRVSLVVLTVPSILGALYFLLWQTYVLRLDWVLAAGQVALQALQTLLAVTTMVATK